MDEHVHRAITAGLRLKGVDVLTAQDDGSRHVADDLLLDRASNLTIGSCIRDLELISKAASPEDPANRVEYLPL